MRWYVFLYFFLNLDYFSCFMLAYTRNTTEVFFSQKNNFWSTILNFWSIIFYMFEILGNCKICLAFKSWGHEILSSLKFFNKMSASNCSSKASSANKSQKKSSSNMCRYLPGIIIGLATIIAVAGIVLGVFGDTPEGQFWPSGFKIPGK